MKRLIFLLLVCCISYSQAVKFTKTFNKRVSGLYDDWWQQAVIYQIYPRSLQDSNNDGDGDLQGIIQRLDHFSDMGIDGIWLSPIYKSPQVDNGYDISDYRTIEPMYGTLDDLKELLEEAHKRDIKVILDFVPNHTSDQHAWFQASIKRTAPYDDYYIWANATYVDGERRPPNNWISTFRGSAWEWNEERGQYYFHQFAIAQPDINYRNPDLVNEMKDVLRYWLEFGVDGFRMDAIPFLVEDALLRDEPAANNTDDVDPDDPSSLNHIYTLNLNETYDMVYQWREVLDEFTAKNKSYTRIMMTEVYTDPEHTMLYYGNETRLGAHFTFNFITFISNTHKGFDANGLASNIFSWLEYLPDGCTSNWVLGNHDQTRVATRLGVENVDPLNMLVGILPGVQITYQGEEIGQENGEVTCEQGYDPQAIKNCSTFDQTSRDFERTPFQWDNTTFAGFTKGNLTWLPVSEKHVETNLLNQNLTGIKSHYNVYKKIVEIRRNFKNANISVMEYGSWGDNVFFLDLVTDTAHYAFVYNIADSDQIIRDFAFLANYTTEIALTSSNSQYNIGDKFDLTRIVLPHEAFVIKVSDKSSE